MKIKDLLIGVIGVITCVQCIPIEVIYTGDSCDCPKNLNYLVNVPPPPKPKEYKPSEYGYKLEVPLQAKAKVTYSFDFTVEEPKIPPPPKENKWDLYAKIDRMTAHKKDCYVAQEVPNTCTCNRCAAARDYRYVLPEEHAARYTRNLPHPNSIDEVPSASTSQVMAIFLEPLNQSAFSGATKSRNKRDISRIFMRPRKNQKRSDRVVKQYNKRLTDRVSNKAFYGETAKPIRSRSIPTPKKIGKRPLQKFAGFLNLPRFRNKRDIKGEYDLIEKEREQMDLTLPEIIQYMPETLDPNFKRNQCNFGEQCQKPDFTETTTKTASTLTPSTTDETSTTTMLENNEDEKETLMNNEDNKELEEGVATEGEPQEDQDNTISTHKKRNAADYGGGGASGGCPVVFSSPNPIQNFQYTLEPLNNYEAMPRPFVSAQNPYGSDPVPQQYVGAPHNPYVPAGLYEQTPMARAAYSNQNNQQLSNAQLDKIITDIVNKHAAFIEASSHRHGALVDTAKGYEHFLKHLISGNWNMMTYGNAPTSHYHISAAARDYIQSSPPLPLPPPPPASAQY